MPYTSRKNGYPKWARYKLTGYLNNCRIDPEGYEYQVQKTLYARYEWTAGLKEIYLQLFYDWVEVEEV